MFERKTTDLGLDAARLRLGLIGLVLLFGITKVAMAISGDGQAFMYIMATGLISLIVWDTFQQRARAKQIRQFAERMGFTYIGSAVLKSFPLDKTSSRLAHSISNAVAGARDNNELLLFDCALGYGKGRFCRTVVAVRGRPGIFGVSQFGPDLVTEQVGEWMVVYGSRRILVIEEIEALVSET